VPADRHWVALDRTFSQVLSPAQTAHARERLSRRVAALSDIYLPRLLAATQQPPSDEGNSTRQRAALRQAHRQLAAALTAAWSENR
jgi:hypothetical protein